MLFPAREPGPTFSDDGVIALREPPYETVRIRVSCGLKDLLVCGIGSPKADVLPNRGMKKENILHDVRDVFTNILER